MRISVVMPVLDESARIGGALAALAAQPGLHERIVVDGGSRDATFARARAQPGVIALQSPRGRGTQLNAGAAVATGEVLLFLHADTTLPHDAAAVVRRILGPPHVVAGAFRTHHVADADAHPWLRVLVRLADVRSRYARVPYGDQALFVRRAAFEAAGGFPHEPIMEDIALGRRLRRRGPIRVAEESVRVSARRFTARPWKTTLCWNVFPVLYRAGVSPARLARWYGHAR